MECAGLADLQVDEPAAPPVVLRGHSGEVSAVAWNPRRFDQVVTCGDDARVRVWTIDRDAAASRKPTVTAAKVNNGSDLDLAMTASPATPRLRSVTRYWRACVISDVHEMHRAGRVVAGVLITSTMCCRRALRARRSEQARNRAEPCLPAWAPP